MSKNNSLSSLHSVSLVEWQALQHIDIFSVPWKRVIELPSHSSLIYLVVGCCSGIDIQILTTWSHCSCKIFGLFSSGAKRPVTGAITISLNHSHTFADVELISFLYDEANISIDGSIDVWMHLDQVHGRLLEQNIILGQNTKLTTLPKLNVASYNVTAAHGANIDTLDQQKLFYMMSRWLTKQQSQILLVDGYIEYVLGHFTDLSDIDKHAVYASLKT